MTQKTAVDLGTADNDGGLSIVHKQLVYGRAQSSAPAADGFAAVAQHMYNLMTRNIASDGFVFTDPMTGGLSQQGAVLASPSYARVLTEINQDYVYNWTRDAAITALEVAAATQPVGQPVNQTLCDYVTFARACQQSGAPLDLGCFLINAAPREWSRQTDGPALRILAVRAALPFLDPATTVVAQAVIAADLAFLLDNYQQPTTNLWEEHEAQSFFARSVQLRCFQQLAAAGATGARAADVTAATAWLTNALQQHWNGTIYQSLQDFDAGPGYDPNIDIVCAAVHGAVPVIDTRLLATAAALRTTWSDPASAWFYPINGTDATSNLGPMFGRYPQDFYDGDTGDNQSPGRHPWALCTCLFAQLYYEVATAIDGSGALPFDALSAPFFAQIAITAKTKPAAASTKVRAAGDSMLDAVVHHSDHLELSEQFDGQSGYEKSVRDLTWSYAAFLSAARARTGVAVQA